MMTLFRQGSLFMVLALSILMSGCCKCDAEHQHSHSASKHSKKHP